MTAQRTLLLVAALATLGCDDEAPRRTLPDVDPATFRDVVYPILLADCAFPACHGDVRRPFHLFGPGRTRLLPETLAYDPATPEELATSFERARSMLLGPDGVRRAPLLRKPLAVAAGGAGHEGDDPWGASPFATKQDPRFEAIFFWATAAEDTP